MTVKYNDIRKETYDISLKLLQLFHHNPPVVAILDIDNFKANSYFTAKIKHPAASCKELNPERLT